MALIFTSGGGRLGNQILNLIHLMALSLEYNFAVIKINDPFLISLDGSIKFNLKRNKITWQINNSFPQKKYLNTLFFKILIRLIHIYFCITPNNKSYKIGLKNNYPQYIPGKILQNNFSLKKIIKESSRSNVAISGWGLRDWELVLKHKKVIVNNMISGFENFLNVEDKKGKAYLLVHIRRADFLDVKEFSQLNFSDEIWIKSILKICSLKSLKKVVIFSDEIIQDFFISSLEINGLEVLIPEKDIQKESFLNLFFSYVFKGSYLLCNSSTLVLSIAFLSHEKIYLPSKEKDFEEILLDDAHNYYPTLLNWC